MINLSGRMTKEKAEKLIIKYLWKHNWPVKDVILVYQMDWPVLEQWTFFGLWYFATGEMP